MIRFMVVWKGEVDGRTEVLQLQGYTEIPKF